MSTPFTRVFGDTPQVRLLDFLADNLEFDYTISQIGTYADLSRPTVYLLVERLTREGLFVRSRTVGRSRFYRINRNNPLVPSLLRSDFAAAREAAESEYKRWRRSQSRARAGRRAAKGSDPGQLRAKNAWTAMDARSRRRVSAAQLRKDVWKAEDVA